MRTPEEDFARSDLQPGASMCQFSPLRVSAGLATEGAGRKAQTEIFKIVLSNRANVPLSLSDCGPAWGSETGTASPEEDRDPVLHGC